MKGQIMSTGATIGIGIAALIILAALIALILYTKSRNSNLFAPRSTQKKPNRFYR
jgi:hypothetical protein